MRDNFVKLMDFIFGKYIYTVMKNNDKVLYFEVVNNKYVQPISSFNLYDNAGKSLTSVNEHFFMNQLVSRINVACKKGIFISNQEIIDFLNKIKASCGDPELMKLFKGSYMNEINEFNFEDNKRNIVRYLDKFKFDTFVDYNNVSVFNGSLEKNVSAEPVVAPSQDEAMNDQNNITENGVVSNIMDNEDVNIGVNGSEEMDVVDVIDESAIDNNVSNAQQSENVGTIDFMNIPVDNSVGDVVNSSDYFSNSQVAQNSNQLSQDNLQTPIESQSDLTTPLDFNSLYSNSETVSEPVQQVQEPVVVAQENIVQSVQGVQTPQLEQSQEIIQPVEQSTVQNIADVQEQPAEQQIVQENPALQPATSSVDLTAPLDFNAIYSNKETVSSQAPAQETVTQINNQVVQENPALQPATSSVDLTAPLDFNAIYSNTESAPIQDNTQGDAMQGGIQMIPNADFSVPNFDNVDSNPQVNDNTMSQTLNVDNPMNQTINVDNSINQNVDENSFPNDGFSLAEPLIDNAIDTSSNYVGEVKERLENNNGLSVMNPNVTESDLEKTVVVDKVSMPPLESVSNEKSKKPKKKKSFGVVIFIIVLLLVLAGFAYFLYNYIF